MTDLQFLAATFGVFSLMCALFAIASALKEIALAIRSIRHDR